MAAISRIGSFGEDEDQEEEVERFDDFTLASSWERFISDIEATCRSWLAHGPKILLEKGADRMDLWKNMYKVKADLKHVRKGYCMEYYFQIENDARADGWKWDLHDLQLCFGVKEFLVIAPQSASGVVLDAPEASKLLSAVAIALSNCASFWPAFVPVHDPSRKAYIGIQNMGTVFTRRFEADRIGSQVPVKLMHLEGLYELFVSKFVYSTVDFSLHLFRVHFKMKLTYRTIPYDVDYEEDDIEAATAENEEMAGNHGGEAQNKAHWDDDCPWSEWYSAEDPVKGFDLVATMSDRIVESSLEMAELENASPHEAEKWILLPNLSTHLNDSSQGTRIGFASQLLHMVQALDISSKAQFMEDFVSVENAGSDDLKSSEVIPSPSVLDRVIKDLFQEGSKLAGFAKRDQSLSRAIKGAPLESLFAQFCLHSLWFGDCNIRAIAVLWIEFVREVRWCWEELQPLPKMPVDGSIDLSTCLINQKLHLLAISIERKREMTEEFQDCIGSEDNAEIHTEEDSEIRKKMKSMSTPNADSYTKRESPVKVDSSQPSSFGSNLEGISVNQKLSDSTKPPGPIRWGSAGPVGSMMLLKSCKSLHAPFTQEPPLMTEDMHEERLQAVEAFGSSLNFPGQLEKDILLSDMSAFKAANPDAVFEDFIRWHSPGDWEAGESKGTVSSSADPTTEVPKDNWSPQGRLSQRMSEHGNLWRKIWDDAPAVPASDQKPLLDPNREGEKILHYLETVRPHQLLEQMVCTAFRASAETLNQTNYGDLKQMTTKLEQLYLTLRSSLRPLQANRLYDRSETIEDLKRLTVVFEHLEKLIALAASLHRKFREAPRLSQSIFTDFFTSYLPTMGLKSNEDNNVPKIDIRREVGSQERRVVSSMFSQPSANQSWRKVLSMGNLLNGHEPILREIVFSMRDSTEGNHYVARDPMTPREEIETYRMYVSGTSNDLRVALSITSSD